MLSRLRLSLTILYTSVAMLLVILLGISTYSILNLYFQNANDAALKSKLASVLQELKVPVSADLKKFEVGAQKSLSESSEVDNEDENPSQPKEIYEGELSTIFILPLASNGELLFNPNAFTPPMDPNTAAIIESQSKGMDFRTVSLKDGSPARILTYSIPAQAGIDVIQLGKSISDQRAILNRFLSTLVVIGGISIVGLGFGSWWVAGRSLSSHQKAWDNQQIFVANASHELRTPLTLIRASADAAKRQKTLNSKTAGLLDDVILETDHMSKLVDDLLLLSRLDAGRLNLVYSLVSTTDLLENIHRQFNRIAEIRSIHFGVKTKSFRLLTDPIRLRQILLILLDNAFTHTPSGGTVSLSVNREARCISFIVEDTGEGIPQDQLMHVFDRFYQVKSDRSGENHGSGLGLSIAKSLTDALGGKIEITSSLGRGTKVMLNLPGKHSDS